METYLCFYNFENDATLFAPADMPNLGGMSKGFSLVARVETQTYDEAVDTWETMLSRFDREDFERLAKEMKVG